LLISLELFRFYYYPNFYICLLKKNDIMNLTIVKAVKEGIKALYGADIDNEEIQVQVTRKDIDGDFTIVVFPFTKYSKKKPEDTAKDIGIFLKNKFEEIGSYNIIKGFLNLSMSSEYWISLLNKLATLKSFDIKLDTPKTFMVEYSSPNTNKPLHLGHIRNNLLGDSISKLLKANGHNVIQVNLINDRGIHICKSMLAYQKWGNGETPESKGIKGDKFVGDFYVMFENAYREQVNDLINQGANEETATNSAPIINEARDLLKAWEENDPKTHELWKKMNEWVYGGFENTYKNLGISFDKYYYESETYKVGKDLILKGIEKGIFSRKPDGSVWIDLKDEGLDEKLLLRADGTTVYITQDIATAIQRFEEYSPDSMIYVVGNEQKYHFQILSLILKKMGYNWYDRLIHLSYGMVELPEGKMKSREGKVVDADDLISDMISTAKNMAEENGKLEDLNETDKQNIVNKIALGALKYFILKVDPKRTMLFNPKESIDFNGNTGPFIQYTNARINSVLRNAAKLNIKFNGKASDETRLLKKEIEILRLLQRYDEIIGEAANIFDPGMIANFCYELSREFNQYYHDHSILKEKDNKILQFRLLLILEVKLILEHAMSILGIEMPERM
jgi:arginyl-tRNA synthetase